MDEIYNQNQSLETLTHEVQVEYQQVSAYFDAYLNTSERPLLDQIIFKLKAVHSVLEFTPYKGVSYLNLELMKIFDQLRQSSASNGLSEAKMVALCQGVLIVPRYLQLFATKHTPEPMLLIAYINNLRAAMGSPLLAVDTFNTLNMFRDVQQKPLPVIRNQEEGRYARQMFLWGLLGYLRQTSAEDGQSYLKVMKQAVTRLHALSNHDLWVLVKSILESIASGHLSMDITRKRLLTELDATIKPMTEGKSVSVNQRYIKQLLFLIYLADSDNDLSQQIFNRYSLPFPEKDDAFYQQLHVQLYGPEQSTVKLLTGELLSCVNSMKGVLLTVKPGVLSDTVARNLSDELTRMMPLLQMCGLDEQAKKCQQLSEFYQQNPCHIQQQDIDKHGEQMLELSVTLENLEYLPGDTRIEQRLVDIDQGDASAAEAYANPARSVLLECEQDLESVMKLIEQFIANRYMPQYLVDARAILQRTKACLIFVDCQQGHDLIQQLIPAIDRAVNRKFTSQELKHWLNSLADSIVLIEHYLLSLREKNDATTIYQLAHKSVNHFNAA